ncbi:hypothetical protein AB0N74_26820 [Streptomyces anulatus]
MGRFPFPDDLVRAQREWHAAYRALAVVRPRHATELRRRLLLTRQACDGHWSEGAPDPAARRPWAG